MHTKNTAATSETLMASEQTSTHQRKSEKGLLVLQEGISHTAIDDLSHPQKASMRSRKVEDSGNKETKGDKGS